MAKGITIELSARQFKILDALVAGEIAETMNAIRAARAECHTDPNALERVRLYHTSAADLQDVAAVFTAHRARVPA